MNGRTYTKLQKVDPKIEERCVRQILDHVAEYRNLTAAAQVVSKRNGVSAESVRRWSKRASIDLGHPAWALASCSHIRGDESYQIALTVIAEIDRHDERHEQP